MNNLKNEEIILIVVLLIFIFSPYQMPNSLQLLGPVLFGVLTVIMITMIFFTKYNPIVYIVLFAAIIKLLNSKNITTQINNNTSNPIRKSKQVNVDNQYNINPVTLEEEVIKQRVPSVNKSQIQTPNYKPVWNSKLEVGILNS